MRYLTRKSLLTIIAAFLLTLGVCAAMYADNPHTDGSTGQPSKECGDPDAQSSPSGFNSGGFSNAESHYAGSDGTASAQHSNSDNSTSQYDVACYQVSNNGPNNSYGSGVNNGGGH